MAQVERIYIATEKRGPIEEVQEATLEAGKGIQGDRYHGAGGQDNHVSLIDKAILDEFIGAQDAELGYGDFRRSIVTSGADLNALVGKVFYLGKVRLRGTELCEPCAWLSENVHPAVLPDLVHKAGLRAVVEATGTIGPGTSLTEREPAA